jgi:hypothetical protein
MIIFYINEKRFSLMIWNEKRFTTPGLRGLWAFGMRQEMRRYESSVFALESS